MCNHRPNHSLIREFLHSDEGIKINFIYQERSQYMNQNFLKCESNFDPEICF